MNDPVKMVELLGAVNKEAFEKGVEEAHTTSIEKGDIVQIVDEGHAWYPGLLIVDEVKPWGVQACLLMPVSNEPGSKCSQAWNRLRTAQIMKVGRAVIMPG